MVTRPTPLKAAADISGEVPAEMVARVAEWALGDEVEICTRTSAAPDTDSRHRVTVALDSVLAAARAVDTGF